MRASRISPGVSHDDSGAADMGAGEGRVGAGRSAHVRPLAEVLVARSRFPHATEAQVRASRDFSFSGYRARSEKRGFRLAGMIGPIRVSRLGDSFEFCA